MTRKRGIVALRASQGLTEPSYAELAAAEIAERQLQEWVRRLAVLCKWKFFHPWMAVKGAPGYFDCTIIRAPRLIFAELKTETGKLTQAQEEWRLEALGVPGAEYYLWTPKDWLSGKIEETLR